MLSVGRSRRQYRTSAKGTKELAGTALLKTKRWNPKPSSPTSDTKEDNANGRCDPMHAWIRCFRVTSHTLRDLVFAHPTRFAI
jgi:hypothetical protein